MGHPVSISYGAGAVRDATGASRIGREYTIRHQIGTAGPQSIWQIFSATSKKPNSVHRNVCIWRLDKLRWLGKGGRQANRHGRHAPDGYNDPMYADHGDDAADDFSGPGDRQLLFQQQRHAAKALSKLRHPRILQLLEPLEESSSQILLVTELMAGTLAQLLAGSAPEQAALSGDSRGGFGSVSAPQSGGSGCQLSAVELQFGLLQLAEALHFLHGQAQVVHCNVSPHSVVVAVDGSFKLTGQTL